MRKNRPLVDLKNIGKKIAARLEEAGIASENDLRKVGAIEAHRRIKSKYPNETLPVCYYLYSFEGAIKDKHWNAIGEKRKSFLKEEIDSKTKQSTRYLALLRGINVGGKNVIAKGDLKEAFEAMGFSNVRTYIQSGNILFRSDESSSKKIKGKIQKELSSRFSYDAQATVLTKDQYEKALKAAPKSWGRDSKWKYYALFLLGNGYSETFYKKIPPPKAGLEKATCGPGVIFWAGLKEKLTRTSIMKLASLPEYQKVTIRNENTVFKLRELFDEI